MMIKAKVIPKLLEQVHVDGIESSLLMRDDGSLLSAAGILTAGRSKDAHVVAAILSNVWQDYKVAGAQLQEQSGPLKYVAMQCEQGHVGSVRLGNGHYIAAACGHNVKAETITKQLGRLHNALCPIMNMLEPQTEDDQ